MSKGNYICNPQTCSNGEYAYVNGSCSSTCPSPFIKQTTVSSEMCNFPCSPQEYLQVDGTCSYLCEPPTFEATNQGGYKYCKVNPIQNSTIADEDHILANQNLLDFIFNNISSYLVPAATLLNTGDSASVSSAMLAKMLQYTKFLNISYSNDLYSFFQSSRTNSGFLPAIPQMKSDLIKNLLK